MPRVISYVCMPRVSVGRIGGRNVVSCTPPVMSSGCCAPGRAGTATISSTGCMVYAPCRRCTCAEGSLSRYSDKRTDERVRLLRDLPASARALCISGEADEVRTTQSRCACVVIGACRGVMLRAGGAVYHEACAHWQPDGGSTVGGGCCDDGVRCCDDGAPRAQSWAWLSANGEGPEGRGGQADARLDRELCKLAPICQFHVGFS